jgi:YebC/PmpR family DNA-binding regulatory protein
MSGHSHFATIKRAKEAKDAQKGKSFSKHARAISIAVKAGGGPDPDSNYKLRMAIEAARADNLPKENIERAISKASTEAANLEESTYEGFGPYGISVIVEVATDNRNRTAQELKNIFEKGGGNMGGPGSVAYNFESKGMIRVQKTADPSAQLLDLIDVGVEDYEETDSEMIIYTPYDKTAQIRDAIAAKNYTVTSAQAIKKAVNSVNIDDADKAKKVFTFVERLEEYEDVQNVYTNMEISDEIMDKVEV